jgi:hypothetical protein
MTNGIPGVRGVYTGIPNGGSPPPRRRRNAVLKKKCSSSSRMRGSKQTRRQWLVGRESRVMTRRIDLISVRSSFRSTGRFHEESLRHIDRIRAPDRSNSGPVAQRLVQGTHNPLVLGSNPSGPTIFLQCRTTVLHEPMVWPFYQTMITAYQSLAASNCLPRQQCAWSNVKGHGSAMQS